MTQAEGAAYHHDFDDQDEKGLQSKQEAEIQNAPPVDTWIDAFFAQKEYEAAFTLIGRVLELHIREGQRLIQKYYSHFGDSSLGLLERVAQYSQIATTYKTFLTNVVARYRKSVVPDAGQPQSSREFIATITKLIADPTQNHPITDTSQNFAISPEHRQSLNEHLLQINKYYGQLILPTIEFPEPPQRLEWQNAIIRAADKVVKAENSKLSWSGNVVANHARKLAQLHFGNNYTPDKIAPLNLEIPKTELEPYNPQEVAYRYNIFEALPPDAKDIRPVTSTTRGMIFAYELDSTSYHFIDGVSYQIDSLKDNQIAATHEHLAISATRNQEEVVIIDDQEYLGYSIQKSEQIENHLIVSIHNPITNEYKTIIDGHDFKFFPFNEIRKFNNYLAITVYLPRGTACYVVSLNDYKVKNIMSNQLKCAIAINYDTPYFVFYGDGKPYVIDQKTTQRYNLVSQTTFIADRNNPQNTYKLFETGAGTYVAFSENPPDGMPMAISLAQPANLSNPDLLVEKTSVASAKSSWVYQKFTEPGGDVIEPTFLQVNNHQVRPVVVGQDVEFIPNQIATSRPRTLLNESITKAFQISYPGGGGYKVHTYNLDGSLATETILKLMTTLEHIYIAPNGTIYQIEYDAQKNKEIYSINLKSRLETIHPTFILGIFDHKPVVMDYYSNNKKLEPVNVIHGDVRLDLSTLEFDPYVGQKNFSSAGTSTYVPTSLALYNPTTGDVKEINPQRQHTVQKYDSLVASEQRYLRLALLCEKYRQLVYDPTPANKRAMQRIKKETKQLLAEIEGPKKFYFHRDMNKDAMQGYLQDNSEELLEYAHPNLDPLTPSFEDQFVQSFLPNIWHNEHLKWGSDSDNRAETKTERQKQIHNRDSVLNGDESELRGGNAEDQFLSAQPLGTLADFSRNGITEALCYQTEKGWQTFPLPRTQTTKPSSATPTKYKTHLHSPATRARLLLQPDSEIDPDSVMVTTNEGTKTKANVTTINGYPVIELPTGAVEVEYQDKKTIPVLPESNWKSYTQLAKEYQEASPNEYAGLTKPLPIDPRVKLQLVALKKLTPLRALIAAEQLCRTSGIYDMDNGETAEAREKLNASQTLEFARVRASSLKAKSTGEHDALTERQVYAGVCAESALLLVAMLRNLGFMAGINREYRPKSNGSYSKYDAHASVFVLWPNEDSYVQNYQLVYLDGTFSSGANQASPVMPHLSLQERITQGLVEVDELDDFDSAAQAAAAKKEVNQEAAGADNSFFSYEDEDKQLVFSDWEQQKIDELIQLDLVALSRLYQTVQEQRYVPTASDAQGFWQASSSKERWNSLMALYASLNPAKKTWKSVWNGARLSLQHDKADVIEKIILALRV